MFKKSQCPIGHSNIILYQSKPSSIEDFAHNNLKLLDYLATLPLCFNPPLNPAEKRRSPTFFRGETAFQESEEEYTTRLLKLYCYTQLLNRNVVRAILDEDDIRISGSCYLLAINVEFAGSHLCSLRLRS